MILGFAIFKYFPFGGVQRDLMKLVQGCLDAGHQVRIYVIRWSGPVPDGVDVRKAPVKALSNHRLYERFAEWLANEVSGEPVDLMIGMNKMPGIDVYYAADSCFEDKAMNQRGVLYRLTPRYRSFRAAEMSVFAPDAKTKILTISDLHTPSFRRYYGTPADRFHRLPPGIERDRKAPSDAGERKRRRDAKRLELGLNDDTVLLLFIGSGFIKKGLDRVLRALKSLPTQTYHRTRLLVVGKDNADPFRRLANRLGVEEPVQFFPEGRADVPYLLLAGDALVLPAYDEAAGMVILEAMIAGLPVLTTENCGYAHFVSTAGAGVVTPMPFEQARFARDLSEVIDSDKRTQWSQAGLALGDDESIYQMVTVAVQLFERFAEQNRQHITGSGKSGQVNGVGEA